MKHLLPCALLLSFSNLVVGFGTASNALTFDEEHEKITRAALECKGSNPRSDGGCFEPESIEELAGDLAEFGAVGDPDKPRILSLEIGEAAEAHCDNADFFAGDPDYPQSREAATQVLQNSVDHLRNRFGQGISEALGLLDQKGLINDEQADVGIFGCDFQDDPDDNAKCKSLQGFGRALHGTQDFYSHSNWGDLAAPPFSAINPPGLGRSQPARFLDLRSKANINASIPGDLTTGCFDDSRLAIITFRDKTPGVGLCARRVTHHTITKDEGSIDPISGATSGPETARGKLFDGFNFRNAVSLAIKDTRDQWRYFRYALQKAHGDLKASRMVCALTRDDPKDCVGRKIALVIDSSSSNQDTDPSNLRITAAKSFNAKLVSAAEAEKTGKADLVTVVDFDTSTRIIYPLGDPVGAKFDGIDSSGGTSIASGISAAIDEIVKNTEYRTFWKSGIVVFTDGLDSNRFALNAQILRALSLGIRVSMGFLEPNRRSPVRRRSEGFFPGYGVVKRQTVSTDLSTAILRTGGVYSVISSAEAQEAFVDLVFARGPTAMDDNSGSTALKPSLAVASLISGAADSAKYFTYTAQPGESVNITVKSLGALNLRSILTDIRGNLDVEEKAVPSAGHTSFLYQASCEVELELIVSAANGTSNSTEGVVTVELVAAAPVNGTNTTSTIHNNGTTSWTNKNATSATHGNVPSSSPADGILSGSHTPFGSYHGPSLTSAHENPTASSGTLPTDLSGDYPNHASPSPDTVTIYLTTSVTVYPTNVPTSEAKTCPPCPCLDG